MKHTQSKMQGIKNLLEKNRRWASHMRRNNPRFFRKLSLQQTPEYFWIGCSDSRVPVNQIIEMLPGQIFVHRNIANLVPPADLNCISALQYAVDILRVKHVIVCGHYGCGGVLAAIKGESQGFIKQWLHYIEDVKTRFEDIFRAHDEAQHWDLLCELNIVDQVINVAKNKIIQDAWQRGQELSIHGWVYQLETGLLQDLQLNISGIDEITSINIPLRVSQNQYLRLGSYYKKSMA